MFVQSLIWHICVIGSICRYFDVHVGSFSSTDCSGIWRVGWTWVKTVFVYRFYVPVVSVSTFMWCIIFSFGSLHMILIFVNFCDAFFIVKILPLLSLHLPCKIIKNTCRAERSKVEGVVFILLFFLFFCIVCVKKVMTIILFNIIYNKKN